MYDYQRYDALRSEQGLGGTTPGQKTQGRVTALGADGVCRVWKQTGYCQKYTEGGKCSYSHPMNSKGSEKKGKGKGKKKKGKDKDGKGKGKKGKGKGKKYANANVEEAPAPPPKPPKKQPYHTSNFCASHTKDGKCKDPNKCGKTHNPTCLFWSNGDCSKENCQFPHRKGVQGKAPKSSATPKAKPGAKAKVKPKPKARSTVMMSLSDDGEDDEAVEEDDEE